MTTTTSTHSKQKERERKNLSRLERAIQRASFAVLKRYKKIPNDPAHPGIRELELTIDRILDHAERLGWLKLKPKIGEGHIIHFLVPKQDSNEYYE